MKRYFKRPAESDPGEGLVYMEFTDGRPSRQVEIYEQECRWADEAHKTWLADRYLEELDLGEEYEIRADEFEWVWQKVVK